MFLARFSSKKETRFNYFSLFLQSLFRMSFTPKFSARKTIFHDSLATIGKKKINPVGFNIYSYRKKLYDLKRQKTFNSTLSSLVEGKAQSSKQGNLDLTWQEIWWPSIHLFKVFWNDHLVNYFPLMYRYGITTNILYLTFSRAEFLVWNVNHYRNI